MAECCICKQEIRDGSNIVCSCNDHYCIACVMQKMKKITDRIINEDKELLDKLAKS